MKRIFLLFLSVLLLSSLLLCGCGTDPVPGTVPPSTAAPTGTAPEEAAGLYDPESALERVTGGAIRCYPLNRADCNGVIPMGDDLVMFSCTETTTLTKLSGENLYISGSTVLNCAAYPDDFTTQVNENGVSYFDEVTGDMVLLDTNLKEVNRVALPADSLGRPVISPDRKILYYCTSSALRALDLNTGLDKLLRDLRFETQFLDGMYCDGTVLKCCTMDEDANWCNLFLSTETGETLYATGGEMGLWTAGDRYFATYFNGGYEEFLTGTGTNEPSVLQCNSYAAYIEPIPTMGGAVSIQDQPDSPKLLDYYDLNTGHRTASLELPAALYPSCFRSSAGGNAIWFLCYDTVHDTDILCRWELGKTPTGDEHVYLDVRRSPENPDLDGLAACAELAKSISGKYGVEILTYTDVMQYSPADYILEAEYQVPLIRHCLENLDSAMSRFPEGFFREAAAGTDSGVIHICLVRSILGNPDEGTLSQVSGLQYWDEQGDASIALVLDNIIDMNFYHELFHVIDSRVLSSCTAYDSWNTLNPAGFEYDYDYIANLNRDDYSFLEGDAQAFIDLYAMSYPKEDRARIMEYAMMPDTEFCFVSATMQAKLRQLCIGIRIAFDLEEYPDVLPWERYLKAPLVP